MASRHRGLVEAVTTLRLRKGIEDASRLHVEAIRRGYICRGRYACVEAIYCKVARLGLSLVIVVATVVLKNAHTFIDLRLTGIHNGFAGVLRVYRVLEYKSCERDSM